MTRDVDVPAVESPDDVKALEPSDVTTADDAIALVVHAAAHADRVGAGYPATDMTSIDAQFVVSDRTAEIYELSVEYDERTGTVVAWKILPVHDPRAEPADNMADMEYVLLYESSPGAADAVEESRGWDR